LPKWERTTVLEANGYIAIALIAVLVVLIFSLVRGKTTKGVFTIVSPVVVFTAIFFWMADRVTEMIIPGVGTIKTAATLATQYVEDIKNIKSDIEHQRAQINSTIEEINEDRREATTIKDEL
jgi:cell division protein FtsB